MSRRPFGVGRFPKVDARLPGCAGGEVDHEKAPHGHFRTSRQKVTFHAFEEVICVNGHASGGGGGKRRKHRMLKTSSHTAAKETQSVSHLGHVSASITALC
jgi:hypothetical protein